MKAAVHLLAGLLVLAVACGDSGTSTGTDFPTRSLLFVQNSDGAVLADATLTLTGVSEQTGWFTDRPYRDAGQISTWEFVEGWDDGATSFADDPPNADFTCEVAGAVVNYVVELEDPVLEGGDLSYTVSGIGEDWLPVSLQCDADAHLFIDSLLGLTSTCTVKHACWRAGFCHSACAKNAGFCVTDWPSTCEDSKAYGSGAEAFSDLKDEYQNLPRFIEALGGGSLSVCPPLVDGVMCK